MESETDQTSGSSRWSSVALIALLIVATLSLAGLYVFARDPYSENEIRRLIKESYVRRRPGGGRLYQAEYSPLSAAPTGQTDLSKAQILLLRYPNSETKQRLQALLYLASDNWQEYIEFALHFSAEILKDPGVLNNLGTCYLALSEKEPIYLMNALEQFERVAELKPDAAEPRFNLIVTYRRLHLHRLAEEAFEKYKSIDSASAWYRELTHSNPEDKSLLLDQLKLSVENNDMHGAERLFEKNPDLFRQLVRRYGSAETATSPAVLHFVASEMERRYGDKTFSAMLAPLFTGSRQATITLRQFVTKGAALYLQGDLPGSLKAYAQAKEIAEQTNSFFDGLWIELNEVDTQVRAGEFETARKTLQHIVSLSRENGFLWLMGKALSVYGSTLRLTATYKEMLELVSEANRIFTDLNAPTDRIRPLYYLAAYEYLAGDLDEGSKLALECLRLTNDEDSLRISELDWLIGFILYNKGLFEEAVLFEKESLDQGKKLPNTNVLATTAITLAQLYESISDDKQANQYVSIADQAFRKMSPGLDQTKVERWLGIVKAKIAMKEKRYSEAKQLLERNIDIYSRQPFGKTWLESNSLTLLAQTNSEMGQTGKAARRFREAIEIIENDDHYLQSEKLRVKFDDTRRDLYDSAVEFEYKRNAPDAAWNHLQSYRSKLFIEFLAQFDPNVERVHAETLDRLHVQKLIPANAQVVEYALLQDRLLIWVVSKETFTVRSVQVARGDVESNVQMVLQGLRNRDDVDSLLMDLGKLLLEPVADLLDRNRTLVVVPDRALHGLPFGVLRRPGSRKYLLQEFPILISPNLTHLLLTKAVEPGRDRITGFGSQNGTSSELKELGALASIYPESQTFAGREAERSNFLSAISKAAVFHYAGHSAKDAVDPLRSSILLDGKSSGPNTITAVDIAQERLPNNALVVLSSCDSSVGNSRDGIGVRGLTSAFLLGGAGSVVGSLWPVEASSTADLMIRFHRAFANSQMPIAKALQEAQLTFLESFPERSHPYYWSGFVVTGNFSALR